MDESEKTKSEEAARVGAMPEGAVPPKKDRFLPISILVAAVIIAGAVIFSVLYRSAAPSAALPPAPTSTAGTSGQPSAATIAASLALTSRDVILGNANAPVTIIEYGDYQCPFCTRYYSQIQPLIISDYVNTGKAKFVFRDFPFLDQFQGGQNESHAAGAAAECAKDQNQFWAYHNALYTAKLSDEAKGGSENDGFFNRALFLTIATQLNMNTTAFTACIDGDKYTAVVQGDYAAGQAAGVDSTPTTFVNGKEVADPTTGQSVGADQNSILSAIATAAQG